MAVKIEIVNKIKDSKTRECIAANDLKDLLAASFPSHVNGSIAIAYSLTLCGQDPRDVDLLMWGKFDNYVLNEYYTNDVRYAKKDLVVDSFCIAIELKEHSPHDVTLNNTHIHVRYKGEWKDATEQNENQRYSVKNYLSDAIGYSPYITNFIWMKSLNTRQLNDLLQGNIIAALSNTFSFKDIVKILILQGQSVFYLKEEQRYHTNAKTQQSDFYNDIKKRIFSDRTISGLIRKKIETLQQIKIENKLQKLNIGNNLTIFKGRAGTGKTFKLIQSALHLANPDTGQRCLLLTYNHALVSDIKRLLHFLDIPDGIDNYSVQIKTLHSFFMQLMNALDISTSKLQGKQFETQYQLALNDLLITVKDLMDKQDLKKLKDDNRLAIDWDYILIDEAQDWSESEKNILFKIYGEEHIIVADGVDQFMRSNQHLTWNNGRETIAFEETGMRQKANLASFVESLAHEMGVKWELKPNKDENWCGGKVIIRKHYSDKLHKKLLANCLENDGDGYDMLFLVPYQMKPTAETKDSEIMKIDIQKWKDAGISLFDGTDEKIRKVYSTNPDECRLYQYESCRGLEGWVTVCLNFDILVENKMNDFKDMDFSDSIVLESNEEQLRKYVYQWVLMPLTRPIDTLVITLHNPDSEIGKLIKNVADSCVDFVDYRV